MLAVVRFERILVCTRGSFRASWVQNSETQVRGWSPSISLSDDLSQVAEGFLSHISTLGVTLPTHLGGLDRKTIFSCFSHLSTGPPVFFLLLWIIVKFFFFFLSKESKPRSRAKQMMFMKSLEFSVFISFLFFFRRKIKGCGNISPPSPSTWNYAVDYANI